MDREKLKQEIIRRFKNTESSCGGVNRTEKVLLNTALNVFAEYTMSQFSYADIDGIQTIEKHFFIAEITYSVNVNNFQTYIPIVAKDKEQATELSKKWFSREMPYGHIKTISIRPTISGFSNTK